MRVALTKPCHTLVTFLVVREPPWHPCLHTQLLIGCFIASQRTHELRLQQYTTTVYVSSKLPSPHCPALYRSRPLCRPSLYPYTRVTCRMVICFEAPSRAGTHTSICRAPASRAASSSATAVSIRVCAITACDVGVPAALPPSPSRRDDVATKSFALDVCVATTTAFKTHRHSDTMDAVDTLHRSTKTQEVGSACTGPSCWTGGSVTTRGGGGCVLVKIAPSDP